MTSMNQLIKNSLCLLGIMGIEVGIVLGVLDYVLSISNSEYSSISSPALSEWGEHSLPMPLTPSELIKSELIKKENQSPSLSLPIFPVGTAETEIVAALGEPTWRKKGYWQNSRAYSYLDLVADGIDLGYLFDTKTNKLRQTEIGIPASTSLETLQDILDGFLQHKTSAIASQGLENVYFRQQQSQTFNVGNLEGIIQRNEQDQIYIGVWEADFH